MLTKSVESPVAAFWVLEPSNTQGRLLGNSFITGCNRILSGVRGASAIIKSALASTSAEGLFVATKSTSLSCAMLESSFILLLDTKSVCSSTTLAAILLLAKVKKHAAVSRRAKAYRIAIVRSDTPL
ncbi:hypothetical protein JCM19235_3511 [Vibrio maritimus]|uniref:Uncharacterized protein n=1 Tax=Vibrio maritimus TaxID=990268 RepID=A0A090S219_9VIBR|nr:hypothetical protein JCM19235_3511 [Vibrio maritimus]